MNQFKEQIQNEGMRNLNQQQKDFERRMLRRDKKLNEITIPSKRSSQSAYPKPFSTRVR